MPETKEYSWTVCNERHENLEKYNELRFHQMEQEQCKMTESIEKIDQRLVKKFEEESKRNLAILIGVLGSFGTLFINLILKLFHI